MITSRRSFGLPITASFLAAGLFFGPWLATAASPSQPVSTRTSATIRASGPVGSATTQRHSPRMQGHSPLAQAATGQWADGASQLESPPLADDGVAPVGFVHVNQSACGPVCDCPSCEVACGADGVYSMDPACGSEVGCGLEIGCGLGAAIDRVKSNHGWAHACEDGCCESACGLEPAYLDDPVCGMETIGDCSCDACNQCQPSHLPICVPILRMDWHSFDFFWGHQGYTGPLNYVSISDNDAEQRSGNGSFGFYQGFNKGSSLKRWLGYDVASQLGVRATQSNFSGSGYTRDRRYQVFVTAGVFRRVDYGLQYGLVLDYLNQDWYFQSNALQLRGELSWRCESCETFGLQFMAGVRDETSKTYVKDGAGNTITSSIRMTPTDQYRLFYRRPVVRNGQLGAFAGWTDNDDALLGSNFSLHLSPRILLATDVTYMIPNEGRSSGGNEQESWNVAVGVVFRPGGSLGCRRYNLPMFDVADNGSFMMDRR